jgi:hypothetical protein
VDEWSPLWRVCPRQRVCDAEDVIETDSEYFIGWGTLTLINAGLAQGKGRSGLAWFLLSLLLGPIATFLIVVMGPPRASA